MDIGSRLKEERERLGLSQTALGAIGDFGKTTVIAWERGTAFPNALFLSDIAEMGADIQYIVTGRRQGQGIGESAVHQAVLDAVDLLDPTPQIANVRRKHVVVHLDYFLVSGVTEVPPTVLRPCTIASPMSEIRTRLSDTLPLERILRP